MQVIAYVALMIFFLYNPLGLPEGLRSLIVIIMFYGGIALLVIKHKGARRTDIIEHIQAKYTKKQSASNSPRKETIINPSDEDPINQTASRHRHSIASREFEVRLMRAREGEFEIRDYDEERGCATILSRGSGNEYHVTRTSCDCQDAFKRGTPCKHMIFLSLKTGDYWKYEVAPPRVKEMTVDDGFVPVYSKYYSGGPTGIGYNNLYSYHVIGRSYGTSPKTGRKTDRKKEIYVNAASKDDAITAAREGGWKLHTA